MDTFPKEVVYEIISYLDNYSLSRFILTSKDFLYLKDDLRKRKYKRLGLLNLIKENNLEGIEYILKMNVNYRYFLISLFNENNVSILKYMLETRPEMFKLNDIIFLACEKDKLEFIKLIFSHYSKEITIEKLKFITALSLRHNSKSIINYLSIRFDFIYDKLFYFLFQEIN